MNKKRQKMIRLLVTQLPRSYVLVSEGRTVNAIELKLLAKEGLDVSNLDLESNVDKHGNEKKFSLKEPKFKLINHNQKIKRAYTSNGGQGIINYLEWLEINNDRIRKIAKELNADIKVGKFSNFLKGLISGGANSFWKNLIAFFVSFVASFSNNDEEE